MGWRQGPGNDFEVGGGGGLTSPGVQGNPYPKLKTPRVSPTIFLGGTHVHLQKQTKINMNDIDSPKCGGGPSGSKVGGLASPLPPPLPSSRAYGWRAPIRRSLWFLDHGG